MLLNKTGQIIQEMIEYETGVPHRINHFLKVYGFDNEFINRVCFIIGNHHSYDNIQGIDYQILVEADFLVNIYENEMDRNQIKSIKNKIFNTKTGHDYLNRVFL